MSNDKYCDCYGTWVIDCTCARQVLQDHSGNHHHLSSPCKPYVGVTKGFKEEIEEWRSALSNEINKPEHYNQGTIECINYLKDTMTDEAFQGYLEGNAKKYLHRWRFKGKDKDLQKARWYLDYWIKHREQGA